MAVNAWSTTKHKLQTRSNGKQHQRLKVVNINYQDLLPKWQYNSQSSTHLRFTIFKARLSQQAQIQLYKLYTVGLRHFASVTSAYYARSQAILLQT